MPRFAFLLSVLVGVLLLGSRVGYAQADRTPFSTLDLRFGGTQNVYRNFLHEFWQPGVGVEASVATPFHLGFAEAGGALHRYQIDTPTVPRFDAVLLFAGWGLAAEVSRVRIESSVRVGNYRMTFDESTFAGVRNESELALGAQGRVALRVAGPVWLHAGGSYTQVYTFLRLKLWYASAGLSYRLETPRWAEAFLR